MRPTAVRRDEEGMKSHKYLLALATAVTALAFTGCDRTVSKNESTTVRSDGTVKSQETTVTQKADGTTVKTEETKKTTPAKP
jgi:hypothetical protein